MNLGQLALLLRGLFLIDAVGINQVHGLPFRIADLAASIRQVMDGTLTATHVGAAGAFAAQSDNGFDGSAAHPQGGSR